MKAVVDKVMYVGDRKRVKNEGDYYHTKSTLTMACPACKMIKYIRFASRFMKRRGMLLTMFIDFFCSQCKFRCEIKDGDIVREK